MIREKGTGVSYSGSTRALGACSLSSILSTPTKKNTQASYIGITFAFQANERGSTPLACSNKKTAREGGFLLLLWNVSSFEIYRQVSCSHKH